MAQKAKIEEKLTAAGVTGAGREFVVKALDPAGPTRCPGIPDTSAMDVLRPEYRVQSVIMSPPTASTWDLYMWFPPGDLNACYWMAAPAPCDFSVRGTPPTGAQLGAIRLQPTADLPGSVQSVTIQGGEGTVGGPAFSMRAPAALPFTFRHMYKSVTVELIAPDVNNQGELYAAQYPPINVSQLYVETAVPSTATGSNLGGIGYSYKLPLNENDMTLSAPECYIGKAKEGCYMPLHHSGPHFPFADVHNKHPLAIMRSETLTFIASPFVESLQFPRFPFIDSWDQGGSPPNKLAINSISTTPRDGVTFVTDGGAGDTGYDGMNIGVIIMRGLAGTSGGGSFAASVQLKILVGLEVIPRPTGVDRVFAKPPESYDPHAVAAYFALAIELSDAYPARFNSLGEILGTIAHVAETLFPVAKQVIPVVYNAVKGLLGGPSSRPAVQVVAPPPPPQRPRSASAPRLIVSTPRRIGKRGPIVKPRPRG